MDEEDQLGVVTDTTPIYTPVPAFAAAIRADFDKWLGDRRDYGLSTLENYCGACKQVQDMPVVGDTGAHTLLRCPDCGTTSTQAMERPEWASLS